MKKILLLSPLLMFSFSFAANGILNDRQLRKLAFQCQALQRQLMTHPNINRKDCVTLSELNALTEATFNMGEKCNGASMQTPLGPVKCEGALEEFLKAGRAITGSLSKCK